MWATQSVPVFDGAQWGAIDAAAPTMPFAGGQQLQSERYQRWLRLRDGLLKARNPG